ncbi:MAG: M55 family metallopeptidase [Planctomycetota bacterium]
MKVYVATDLEGVAGVCRFVQTREDGPRYDEARELLTRECSACVDGLVEAGVDEIYVRDGHGRPYNLVPELLHPAARHIVGHSPDRAAVLAECDAVILLAYHAMAGTPDGVLCHTQSSRGGNKYWYNGRESGEIAQHALIAGHFDIPVIMVTGDDATCREAREFLGDGPVTVSTKTGLAREGAVLLAPSLARERIREGATEAVGRVSECEPYKIDLPIRGRLWFPSKETADRRHTDLAERVDDFTFEATFETALDVLRF